MSKGYMRISRDKLISWCWRGNMNKNYLMMFLLVNANYKSERFEKIIVERGQYIFSYDGLSRDCGMPLQTLRTTLKDLVETNQITIKSTRKWSLLTICEYDSWQIQDNETNTQLVTQTGTQVVTQMDNNIINKEIDNKDNKKIKEEKDSKESKKKKEELDFSIVEEQFMPTVNDWLEYKKERGESYKPKGFKSFYGRLTNLSNNDPVIAKKIIEKSMSCNYAGIFALKESEVKRDGEEDDEKLPMTKRFANWVDKYYPTIRDMEMPNNDQLNEMLRICNNEIEGYLDRLQDDYHTGSLYDLFIERFGNG